MTVPTTAMSKQSAKIILQAIVVCVMPDTKEMAPIVTVNYIDPKVK